MYTATITSDIFGPVPSFTGLSSCETVLVERDEDDCDEWESYDSLCICSDGRCFLLSDFDEEENFLDGPMWPSIFAFLEEAEGQDVRLRLVTDDITAPAPLRVPKDLLVRVHATEPYYDLLCYMADIRPCNANIALVERDGVLCAEDPDAPGRSVPLTRIFKGLLPLLSHESKR